jgi:hypothetical protein
VLICSDPQNSQKLSVIAPQTESSDHPQLHGSTCIHRGCSDFARPTTEHLGGLGGAGMGLHGLQNLQESARPISVSLQISHHTSAEIALQINGLRVVQGGLVTL